MKRKSFSEVVEINPRRFTDPISDGDELSFVPMKAVEAESGRMCPEETKKWGEVKKGYTPFENGDVLFAKITPCMENGKFALAKDLHKGRGAGSTEFHVFRAKSGLLPQYLLYFLFNPTLRSDAKRNMRGAAGQLRVPVLFFENLTIPVPPLPEQQRIVSEIERQLTCLEAAVTALRRVERNLRRYRAAVLKSACEGRLVQTEAELARKEKQDYETGKQLLTRLLAERRKRFTGRGKYKEPAIPDTSKLGPLPKGWTWATVEQVGEVQLGRQRSPKHISKDYPTKYIRAANITEKGLILDDVLEMEFTPDEKDRFLLKNGDIVLSEASGSASQVGKPAIWRNELSVCCFQNTVIRHRVMCAIENFALLLYRHYYLNGYFSRIAGGVGINHLSANKFSLVPFPLPPLAEQPRIVEEVERRLSLVDEVEQIVKTNLRRAANLKQAILKKAFEG